MKYNPNPKHGDPVRVRIAGGEIMAATYDEYFGDREHFVFVGGEVMLASSEKPATYTVRCNRVRFVYPVEQMKQQFQTVDGA